VRIRLCSKDVVRELNLGDLLEIQVDDVELGHDVLSQSLAPLRVRQDLISTSTPAERSSFMSASSVCWVGSRMSRRRLWVRISNCSRLFLSTCGERSTVNLLIRVGSGIGPATRAPVRRAVSTISPALWSRSFASYAFSRMRIFCVAIPILDCGPRRAPTCRPLVFREPVLKRTKGRGLYHYAPGDCKCCVLHFLRGRHHEGDALPAEAPWRGSVRLGDDFSN